MATATKTRPRSVAIYCRISHDSEGSQLGVRRQEEDCRELAERRSWPVSHIFIDNDISAYSGKYRPQYREMLRSIEDGTVDGLVVWHLDRLHRHPKELEEFFEVCDRSGLRHMASVSGDIDLSQDDGRFHARILGAVARKESDDKSRRIRRKHVELAKEGRPLGGVTVPFGYVYDPASKRMTQVPAQARVVKGVFERYAEGWGLREIARYLEDRGVVGKLGRTRWSNGGITKILDNPTYAGYRHYEGELTQGQWTPIVTPELWGKVEKLRQANKADTPSQNRKGKGRSLLSGLLFCVCGEPMWLDAYVKEPNKSCYLCSRAARKRWGDCKAGGISALRVEQLVSEAFLEVVQAPYGDRVQRLRREDIPQQEREEAAIEERMKRVEQRMERLVEMSLEQTGPLAAKAFRKKSVALEAELDELKKQHAHQVARGLRDQRRTEDIEVLRSRLKDLPTVWNAADVQEKNQMLKLALDGVDVTTTERPKQIAFRWAGWLASA